jgi:hypothetical protein
MAEINILNCRVYCKGISKAFGTIKTDFIVEDVEPFQTLIFLQGLCNRLPARNTDLVLSYIKMLNHRVDFQILSNYLRTFLK